MADTFTPEERSRIMSRIKSKGMKPEMKVRRLLHGLGYRYRLQRADLPGHPDIVFPSRRKIVFVNGCFWHYHSDCPHVRMPTSNREYWETKLNRNRVRDERSNYLLGQDGWAVMTVWECQLKDMERVTGDLVAFLEHDRLPD